MFTMVATEENQNRSKDTHSWACLSTDTKRVDPDIKNGDILFEMDTKKIYMFDEDSKTWNEMTGE